MLPGLGYGCGSESKILSSNIFRILDMDLNRTQAWGLSMTDIPQVLFYA